MTHAGPPPSAPAGARAAAPTPPGPAAPPAPTKPEAGVSRRRFLGTLGLAWTAFIAAFGAATAASLRFMFPNVLFEPPTSIKVGVPSEFAVGQVDERFKNRQVWLVRNEQGMYALKTVCTHLGCTPNWLAAEEKFKCPCHGSGFYMTGIHFEGPAPRPLERYRIYLADDGQVVVDKSRIYQYEKGQWADPDSFLVL
jgi:cytochrome b6-f complex iron-sulfur subunit